VGQQPLQHHTAWRAPHWRRRAPTCPPRAPCSSTWSTQGGVGASGWGQRRGRGGVSLLGLPGGGGSGGKSISAVICTIQRSPPMQWMVHSVLGRSQERNGCPWLAAFVLTCCTKMLPSMEFVVCHVIFDGEFLLAARQFSLPEAAKSQFWLHSCMHKLCPHATTLQKPSGHGIIITNSILQGSILMKMLLDKTGKGGRFW
jgi:hypothetical protein